MYLKEHVKQPPLDRIVRQLFQNSFEKNGIARINMCVNDGIEKHRIDVQTVYIIVHGFGVLLCEFTNGTVPLSHGTYKRHRVVHRVVQRDLVDVEQVLYGVGDIDRSLFGLRF